MRFLRIVCSIFHQSLLRRVDVLDGTVMTAIFASVGMTLQTFLIAAVVALPKQFASVYFGVAENSGAPTDDDGSTYQAGGYV